MFLIRKVKRVHLFENCDGGPAFIAVNTGPAFPVVSTLRSFHEGPGRVPEAGVWTAQGGRGRGEGACGRRGLVHLAAPVDGACPCSVDTRRLPREGRAALSCRWAESVRPTFQASLPLQKGGSGRRSEEDTGRRVDTGPPRPSATQARLV